MDNFLMRQQWNDQISDPQSVIRNNARLAPGSQNYRNINQGTIKFNNESPMTTINNPGIHEYAGNMPPGCIQYEQQFMPVYSGSYQRNHYDFYNNNVPRNVVTENAYKNNGIPIAGSSKYAMDVGNQFQQGRQTDSMQGLMNNPGNSSLYMVQMGHNQPQPTLRQTSLLHHEGFVSRYQPNTDHESDDILSEVVVAKNQPMKPVSVPKALPKPPVKSIAKEVKLPEQPQTAGEPTVECHGRAESVSAPIITTKGPQPDSVQVNQKARADKFKSAHAIGLRVFIGNVEKVMKWYKTLHASEVDCLYEVIGKCMGVRRGRDSECQLLVRDAGGNGPVLQVVFWEIDFLMSDVSGQVVRVIGKMVGSNKLHAYKVRKIFGTEVLSLPRLSAIGQHIVTKVVKGTQK